jgi:ATP-binding cassette subfamily F protein 3
MVSYEPAWHTAGVSIRAENITLSYGAKAVLDRACFTIDSTRVNCLVGRNGAGKTTLLRILARQLEPDSGEMVVSHPDYTVAYVPQIAPALQGHVGALGFLLDPRSGGASLSDGDPSLTQSAPASASGGPESFVSPVDSRETSRVLVDARKGLTSFVGLPPGDHNMPLKSLSGGQRTRLLLLSALAGQPDLLLLDEPDNNLDRQGRQWLVSVIKAYPGTVLVVGHRALFVTEIAERVLELCDQTHQVHTYTGGYLDYLELRAARADLEEKERLKLERERRRLKAAIQKQLRLAQRSRRGPGQRKDKDKLAAKHKSARAAQKHQDQATRLKRRLAKMPDIEQQQVSELKIQIEPAHCGHSVLRASGLKKSYGRTLFEDFSLRVTRGEHIAVLGPNASGKTTLLRMLAGLVEPDEGEIRLGKGVVVGYFPQELEGLPDISVLKYFRQSVAMDVTSLRRELSHYQLTEDGVFSRMRSLSTGERARVFLVQFALNQANLLLLDEPTNNLDPQSRERLIDALANYAGTMLVVSHDEAFLSKLSIDKTLRLGEGAILTEYGLTQ